MNLNPRISRIHLFISHSAELLSKNINIFVHLYQKSPFFEQQQKIINWVFIKYYCISNHSAYAVERKYIIP